MRERYSVRSRGKGAETKRLRDQHGCSKNIFRRKKKKKYRLFRRRRKELGKKPSAGVFSRNQP